MSWLEIRLDLTGELAEPVAELFSRYADGGVALEVTPAATDSANQEPSVSVRAYLPYDDRLEASRQAIERGLWHLSQISPLPDPLYVDIPQKDWNEAWRKHYQPMPIGETLLVCPAWLEEPQTKRKKIILEPGMAFGTGTHPSTKLSLIALEQQCKDGDEVIDIGCGSGILSIGAILCGASSVLALDIDAQAIASARHNLELNKLSDRVRLVQGSLSEAGEHAAPQGAALLVANILAPILIELLGEGLSRLVAPEGIVILSGILEDQLESVSTVAEGAGLRRLNTHEEADWRALALIKK